MSGPGAWCPNGAAACTRAAVACLLLVAVPSSARSQAPAPPARPRILIDQSPRAVDYQLRRLSNDELAMLDRQPGDPRYRLVYYALLTRTGLARQYRDEALAVLVALDRLSRPRVLLEALRLVAPSDEVAADRLVGVLLAEPIDLLRQDREAFVREAQAADAPGVSRRGAFAAWMLVDGTARSMWETAAADPARLVELLHAVRSVVDGDRAPDVARELAVSIPALLAREADPVVRAAAAEALGWVSRDRAAIDLLSRELGAEAAEPVRAAAVASLLRIPLDVWTADRAGAAIRAILGTVGDIPPSKRTEPSAVDAIRLGDRVAAALPADERRVLRRALAALGVQVVRIETVPEEMRFTVRWFVVQAGRRVQIVLVNRDAMPHNVVVGRPGSLASIGTAAATMAMPSDPSVLPYVPQSPMVLGATTLVREGETGRVNIVAPAVTGEYIFACTYPGHWARMYGVMLVVDDLEAWDLNKTYPMDPITNEVLR